MSREMNDIITVHGIVSEQRNNKIIPIFLKIVRLPIRIQKKNSLYCL